MKLSKETCEAILELQKRYPEKRSALIPALHLAQAERGYLPREVQNQVAELFGIDPNEVNGVVTFYDMFFEEPVGKHQLRVCKNVSCMLRGSDQLLKELCRRLHIEPGKKSSDGEFSVIPSECLAACDRAPMILADDKVIGPVQLEDLDKILEEVKQGPAYVSPVRNKGWEHA